GNLMWAPDLPPRLVTVLDSELSTTGDPRLDLGYFMIAYPASGITRTPLQDLGRALDQADLPPTSAPMASYAGPTRRALADPHPVAGSGTGPRPGGLPADFRADGQLCRADRAGAGGPALVRRLRRLEDGGVLCAVAAARRGSLLRRRRPLPRLPGGQRRSHGT